MGNPFVGNLYTPLIGGEDDTATAVQPAESTQERIGGVWRGILKAFTPPFDRGNRDAHGPVSGESTNTLLGT